MDLKDFKIIPGVVIDASDPKYIGRVKADAPGLFDSSVMNKEGLPWIYHIDMPGYQKFSKINVGSKIWILTNNDFTEFWYWPMFELNQDTKDIISADENDYSEAEVLLSRNLGENSVYIYYVPSQGIMIKQGENQLINLSNDGKIILKSDNGQITIKDDKVYIGNGELSTMHQAVDGQKLVQYLEGFKNALSLVATSSLVGYTSHLKASLKGAVDALNDPKQLLAENIYIN